RATAPPAWTEPPLFALRVPCHMQDMHENNCDPVHFQFVHGNLQVPESTVSYAEGGRFMRMSSRHVTQHAIGGFEVELERDSWGLGLSAVRMVGIPDTGLLMWSATRPSATEHTDSQLAV